MVEAHENIVHGLSHCIKFLCLEKCFESFKQCVNMWLLTDFFWWRNCRLSSWYDWPYHQSKVPQPGIQVSTWFIFSFPGANTCSLIGFVIFKCIYMVDVSLKVAFSSFLHTLSFYYPWVDHKINFQLQHEAGHFLIAYLLGILPKSYTLSSLKALSKEGSLNVQAGTNFVDFEFIEEVSYSHYDLLRSLPFSTLSELSCLTVLACPTSLCFSTFERLFHAYFLWALFAWFWNSESICDYNLHTNTGKMSSTVWSLLGASFYESPLYLIFFGETSC